MAIAIGRLVCIDEGGGRSEFPMLKSHALQFERYVGPRRENKHFDAESTIDVALMAFRIVHGRWPASDEELDSWFDSVSVDLASVDQPVAEEPDPTGAAVGPPG